MKPPKPSRRGAREIALQALYAWQMTGGDAGAAVTQAREFDDFALGDAAFAEALIRGVIGRASDLEALITPHLTDRSYAELSPVERAVLCIGTFELAACPETPLKVVLNEAIDLGRDFGGSAGHRFVNGVLEQVANALRPGELARLRQTA